MMSGKITYTYQGKKGRNRFAGSFKGSFLIIMLMMSLILTARAMAQDPPSISYFSPTGGPIGTVITVAGENFDNHGAMDMAVSINGAAAQVTQLTGKELKAVAGPGTSTGLVQLATSSGTATSSAPFIVSPLTIHTEPAYTNILLGNSSVLTASVTGNANTNVTWSVNGITGGNATFGTVTQTNPATYTAPASLPGSDEVLVSAASAADANVRATTLVRLIDPAGGVPDIRLPLSDPADYSVDQEIWQPISRKRVIVLLQPGATINALLPSMNSLDARIIGGLPQMNCVFLEVPDPGTLDEAKSAVNVLSALPSVITVAHDCLLSPDMVSPESEGDIFFKKEDKSVTELSAAGMWSWEVDPTKRNWGMEYANFPQAWNLYYYVEKQVRRVEVGVADSRIFSAHEDVDIVWIDPARAWDDPEEHGTHVAGIIGAKWNDVGINGACPFADIANQPDPGGPYSTWGSYFSSLGDSINATIRGIVDNRPNVRVINSSQGYNWSSNQLKDYSEDNSHPKDGDYNDPADVCVDNNGDGDCLDPGDIAVDNSNPPDGDFNDLVADIYMPSKFIRRADPAAGGDNRIWDAPSTPENNAALMQFVRAQGIIARAMANNNPNILFVSSAGNSRMDLSNYNGVNYVHSAPNAGAVARIAQWNVIGSEYNSPFDWAAYNGASNVIVVEALSETDNRNNINRTYFSNIADTWPANVFGFSAPGDNIMSTVPAVKDGAYVSAYKNMGGTSMAAPHVTGLISLLYSIDPDLTPANILTILRQTSRASANAASAIDAFGAVMYIDTINQANARRKWVKKALLNIDDGTVDGNDRNIEEDSHGSGNTPPDMRINMSDFRRFRDAYLQLVGRGSYLSGPADSAKRDLNGDGVIRPWEEENVYPRADFNGNGVLSHQDLEVMADPDLWNDDVIDDAGLSPEELQSELYTLLTSGDIKLDADALLEDPEVDNIKVSAKVEMSAGVYKVYKLTITEDDIDGAEGDKRKVFTLPAEKTIQLWATAYKGAERRYFVLPPDAPKNTQLQEGEDKTLLLSKVNVTIEPTTVTASYDDSLLIKVKLNVGSISVDFDSDLFDIDFTIAPGLGTISVTPEGFSLETLANPGEYLIEAVLSNKDGEAVNAYDEPAAIAEAIVRTAVVKSPGGMALDSLGNMYVADTEKGAITFIPPAKDGLIIVRDLDHPADVEVDALGRSIVVAEANGKVSRHYFGLTAKIKNPAGLLLSGASVFLETPAGVMPGETSEPNRYMTNEDGGIHVMGLLSPTMGPDPVQVVVTVEYEGKSQAFPVTLESVGQTVTEFEFSPL